MSKSEKPDLAKLLEHQSDPTDDFCKLCEASSIAGVVLPHAIALGERSEVPVALMALELAAQALEGLSFAEDIDIQMVLAAVQRRVSDLRGERESEGVDIDAGTIPHLRH